MKPGVALAVAFACAGCVAEPVDSRPVVVESGNGLLVVDWSIDGAQDPDVCQRSDADVINVAVETSGGCSIRRAPRTTAVDLGFFEIFGDDELVAPVDFPPSSFY